MDEDLWFDTGDNARMDGDGHIRITGRSRDIIIRGGENVPVVEVENLLYRHPDIVDAALIGLPDPRLGERGCAVVTLRDGARMTLDDLVAFLSEPPARAQLSARTAGGHRRVPPHAQRQDPEIQAEGEVHAGAGQ